VTPEPPGQAPPDLEPAGDPAGAPAMDVRDRRAPVPWEWFDALLVYLVWIVVSSAAAVAVVGVAGGPEVPTALALQVLVAVGLLTGMVAGWVRARGGPGAVARLLGLRRPAGRDVLVGLGHGLAAFVVVQIGLGLAVTAALEAAGRDVPEVQQEVQAAVQGGGAAPLLVVLGVALLAPLAEELLFRGVLYQALAKRLPGWPAVGLSGLAFGVSHVEPFVVVLTFPLGMWLAWALRRSGTLVVPIVAHAVFNAIGVALIRGGA
jgi:uncharacterized protein